MDKFFFSCTKFTVLLVMRGQIIVEAAPIVRKFEGQTLAALAAWVKSKSWGPIIVEILAERPTVVSRVLHDDLGRKSKCWN